LVTLSYGLVLVEGQRRDQEAHLGHGAPVVQDAHAPHARPQRLVERRPVVGELGGGVDQDVVGGGDDVDGVDPHHGHRHVGALAPALHAHHAVHGPHQAPDVPEQPLLGVPLCADLMEEEGGGGGGRQRRDEGEEEADEEEEEGDEEEARRGGG